MTLGEPLRSTDGFDSIGMSQREIRLAMLANGYEPLPLIGKAPIPKKWEQIIINEEMIHGWANAGPNTGMRAATAPVLDIDILDEQAAQIVEATARLYLEDKGKILVRIGLPPKRAILLSTDKPFKKIIRKLTAPDGKVHKIEVLGNGQQLAVAGVHPDTQRPYVWKSGKSPVDTPRNQLPLVGEDEIRTILDLCVGELQTKLGWGEIDVAPPADTNGYDAAYTPISERIEGMQYGGEFPINDTLLAYSGEQLRHGIPCNDVIEDCMARAHRAYEEMPGDPQERPVWDWTKMRHQIEAMVYGYIDKNHKNEPRVIETLPTGMLEKWRKIEKFGGSPAFKKRRHWGVEDTGPAEEIPTVEAPPIARRFLNSTTTFVGLEIPLAVRSPRSSLASLPKPVQFAPNLSVSTGAVA
jgi:Bifunctional DNA primase/polymerase, N-terminal